MNRRRLPVVLSLTLAGLSLPLAGTPASAAPAASASSARPYDFDGNGYPELVVGVGDLRAKKRELGGAVVVLPASRTGLSLKEQVLTEASPEVAGEFNGGNQFGSAFVSADFNRDGYADLAVGRPGVFATGVGGAVTVLFGSAEGLRGRDSVELVAPVGHSGRFGAALAAADFDADGWPDLAVGDPSGDRLAFEGQHLEVSGAVTVFRGGDGGFDAGRSTVVRGRRAAQDHDIEFGSTLAAGDLDADGRADLVIGAEGRSYDGGFGAAGSVTLCSGAVSGVSGCTRVARDADYAGLSSLALGNVSGTSRPEIVLGVPYADLDAKRGGAVHTLTLSGTGSRTTVSSSALTQDSPGVPGSDEDLDQFGTDVVLGDLDDDGYADLVVGAPWEDVGRREDAGRVTVVHGGPTGYRTSGNQLYDQDTKGIPGKAEEQDSFGGTVALVDHDQDGHLDLTVGVPREDGDLGAVTTLRGQGTGFTTRGARTFGLKKLGYRRQVLAGFGETLGR